VLLVRRQPHLDSPLLPLDLLAYRPFAVAVAVMFVAAAAQLMAFVSLPFLFREACIARSSRPGSCSPPGADDRPGGADRRRPVQPHPAGSAVLLGLGVLGAGLVLLGALSSRPTTLDIVWRVAVCGLGYGLFQPPNSAP